jgi:Lon protease-like protein
MKLNRTFSELADLPGTLPLFPLAGALLLPRRPIQLTVFEPRYLAMLDDSLSGERMVGMIQPAAGEAAMGATPALAPVGCAGRIVQYAEIGDGRCFLTLMGVGRFRIAEELTTLTPYRMVRPSYADFAEDLVEGYGEVEVDREALLAALKAYAKANGLKVDWDDVGNAPNEALVNALSMMSPYGPKEKQALLEARDLKARAEILVAISQMDIAHGVDAPRHLH